MAGVCARTELGGDCEEDAKGAWPLDPGVSSLAEALRKCKAQCQSCKNCAFVSAMWRECSWFATCDMQKLDAGADGLVGRRFRTAFVKRVALPRHTTTHERIFANVAAAGAPQHPIRIFVANTSEVCTNFRGGKDLFEEKVPDLIRSSSLRAPSPEAADAIYHPACLTDAYFRLRHTAPHELVALEARVLRELEPLRSARKPIIVNALRCFTRAERAPGQDVGRAMDLPRLWRSHRYLRICLEAFPELDTQHSLNIPYCPRRPLVGPSEVDAGPHAERPISVVFIGSEKAGHGVRHGPLKALRRTPGWQIIPIHSRDVGVRFDANQTFSSRDSRLAPMKRAVFTLCPAGDTPESERIYHAISQGSIPLLDPRFQRPGIVDWGSMSWPLRIDPASGALELPGPQQQAALRRGVWRVRETIDCEASNPAFRTYIEAGLRRMLSGR